MKWFIALLLLWVPQTWAIDGCSECHDDKWKVTPAHVWIETEHHIDVVVCVDCHRWKDGKDLPPVLPSKANLNKDCGLCHEAPHGLAKKMNMEQYEQLAD